MAFKIKTVSKTSIPDPRQMMESMTRLRHDVGTHAKTLWIVVSIVTVVAAIAGGIYVMKVQAEQTAQDYLQQATRLYMNRPLNDTDVSLSHVRQAVDLLQLVVEDYPKSTSAPLALHLLGNSLIALGDQDGAIAMYQRFLRDYPSQGILNSLVRQRLAYAYLEHGNMHKAERAFEEILTIDKAPNKDLALLELASLGEQQNQLEAALVRYQELIKGYPHSIYLREASSKVRVLGGSDGAFELPSPRQAGTESDARDKSEANP